MVTFEELYTPIHMNYLKFESQEQLKLEVLMQILTKETREVKWEEYKINSAKEAMLHIIHWGYFITTNYT